MLSDVELYTGATCVRTISNGSESCSIYQRSDGKLVDEDGDVLDFNPETDDLEDFLDDFEETWREIHWNSSDYADYYGCDEDELGDAFDADDPE